MNIDYTKPDPRDLFDPTKPETFKDVMGPYLYNVLTKLEKDLADCKALCTVLAQNHARQESRIDDLQRRLDESISIQTTINQVEYDARDYALRGPSRLVPIVPNCLPSAIVDQITRALGTPSWKLEICGK